MFCSTRDRGCLQPVIFLEKVNASLELSSLLKPLPPTWKSTEQHQAKINATLIGGRMAQRANNGAGEYKWGHIIVVRPTSSEARVQWGQWGCPQSGRGLRLASRTPSSSLLLLNTFQVWATSQSPCFPLSGDCQQARFFDVESQHFHHGRFLLGFWVMIGATMKVFPPGFQSDASMYYNSQLLTERIVYVPIINTTTQSLECHIKVGHFYCIWIVDASFMGFYWSLEDTFNVSNRHIRYSQLLSSTRDSLYLQEYIITDIFLHRSNYLVRKFSMQKCVYRYKTA